MGSSVTRAHARSIAAVCSSLHCLQRDEQASDEGTVGSGCTVASGLAGTMGSTGRAMAGMLSDSELGASSSSEHSGTSSSSLDDVLLGDDTRGASEGGSAGSDTESDASSTGLHMRAWRRAQATRSSARAAAAAGEACRILKRSAKDRARQRAGTDEMLPDKNGEEEEEDDDVCLGEDSDTGIVFDCRRATSAAQKCSAQTRRFDVRCFMAYESLEPEEVSSEDSPSCSSSSSSSSSP